MTAQSWAAGIHETYPKMWRALEVAAFKPHPSVLVSLDPQGPEAKAWRRRNLAWAIPVMLVAAAVAGAPIWGFTTLLGDRFGRTDTDPAVTIPAAGACFAVALVAILVTAARWLYRGRPRSILNQYAGGVTLVLGALSSVAAIGQGMREEPENWQPWAAVIISATIAGGLFLLAVVLSRRANPGPDDVQRNEPLAPVRRQVAQLSAAERAAVQEDIHAALRDLAGRGVIREKELDWALRAEPGTLAMHMSQRRKK